MRTSWSAPPAADLGRYVVTDALRGNFDEALGMVGHAVTTGRSQAKFLHCSFRSGKSHFMPVLRDLQPQLGHGAMVLVLDELILWPDEMGLAALRAQKASCADAAVPPRRVKNVVVADVLA